MNWKVAVVFVACAAALTAQTDKFTSIEYPGATMTHAQGINDAGDIVGQYTDSSGLFHGFLLSGGTFTTIDFPGARQTWAMGINSRGDISGYYGDGSKNHGYLLSRGEFKQADCSGDGATTLYSVNSSGDIAGYFTPTGKRAQAVVWSRGVCTLSEYRPDVSRGTMTMFFGINDAGVAVGHWATNGGSSHGLVYDKGAFTEITHGPGNGGVIWGVSNTGDMAGQFGDANGTTHGFLLTNGRFTQIDFPGAISTDARGINSSGQIVGAHTDSSDPFVMHGYVARVTPAGPPPPVLMVDDDGVDCPGALPTIQEAVARAPAGSTILVCPGTYRGTVNIIGPEKTAVKLIAVGREDEVVLHGDYTERDGFHLENVTNVVIRGFTVRDFGATATTAADWGVGNQIYLENADYNTIENNRVINGDMMGVMLINSGHNIVQHNLIWVDNVGLANCGVHVQGPKSAGNTFSFNMTYGAKMAGVMLSGAGPGNRVLNNTVLSNGRDGIYVGGTNEVWVEGNRVSYNRGPWGTTPFPKEALGEGFGIRVLNSNKTTVLDNRALNNTGADLSWDGNGENRFEANACGTSTAAGTCSK